MKPKQKRIKYAILAIKKDKKRPLKIAKTNNWNQAKNQALKILESKDCNEVSIERHEQIWRRRKKCD